MRFIKSSAILALAAMGLPLAVEAGNVTGTVKFDGERPKRTVIKMDADAKCAAIHGDKKVGSEDAIVSKEGMVQNAFVHVKAGVTGKFDPPATAATIDQKGCQYTPHVQGILVDQKFNIVNSDPTSHNIHSLAKENPEFNVSQPNVGTLEKVMKKVEKPIKFKCDIHPWMSAYVFVMEHPFFGVTDKDGKFTIANLPDGEYTVEVWHETLGTTEAKIKVAGGDVTQDFTLKK